jgi:Ca2+-binding RTX toxin-like protein
MPVHGTALDDVLDGADGVTGDADSVYGYNGDDTLYGLGGGDTLYGGADADTLYGGSGRDTASYYYSDAGVIVSLFTGTGTGGEAEGDILNSIENITGSDHDDTLIGNDGNNVLRGVGGNNVLKGGGGADTLVGGPYSDTLMGGSGADFLDGGHGADTADYSESGTAVFVSLITDEAAGGHAEGDVLEGIENLTGSDHADVLWGDDGINVLRGLDGSDTLKGAGGADTLYGGDGSDQLVGMDGDDLLQGQNGQDSLNGGAGRDHLYGGNGADNFIWWDTTETGVTAASADEIRDFNRAQGDEINLSAIDADVHAAGDQAFSFIGTDAFSGTPGEIRYYHFGGNTYIELQIGNEVDVEGLIMLAGIHDPEASWFWL